MFIFLLFVVASFQVAKYKFDYHIYIYIYIKKPTRKTIIYIYIKKGTRWPRTVLSFV